MKLALNISRDMDQRPTNLIHFVSRGSEAPEQCADSKPVLVLLNIHFANGDYILIPGDKLLKSFLILEIQVC